MEEHLKDGVSMVIFPEGTCNTTPHLLKDFKIGAFVLSLQTNIPVAVCTIVGAGELMPRSGLFVRPGKISVKWQEILLPQNYQTDNGMNKMIEDTRSIMEKELVKFYPEGYSY